MRILRLTLVLAISVGLLACSADNPPLTGRPLPPPPAVVPKTDPRHFSQDYRFARSEATAAQDKYDENEVSTLFQATRAGVSVNDLVEANLQVKENGIPVGKFKLEANQQKYNQVAEIIFVVDITGTMVELIESAKRRLKEFIRTSRERGFHTRMCFSTFGDYTVKKCTRFYDNNPNDKSTQAQVKELLTELSKINAFRGQGRDPGYPDLDENPMGALVDAAKAPWSADAQRFVILVTDWGFLYLPENPGKNPSATAPTMAQVHESIKASGMNVFAVTRTQHSHRGKDYVWDGYNTPFQGHPGIVQASNGEHYDFDKVLRGEVSLDYILERILMRIKTTYKVSYVVDENPGLDPSLPIEQRKVEISTNPAAEIKMNSVTSSMPTGRPQYKQTWKVAEEGVRPESLKVWVDGKELPASEFSVQGGQVSLAKVPAPGAKLRFSFYYEAIEKNFRIEPLTFAGALSAQNTKVYLNGKEARAQDLIFTRDLEGNTSVALAESVLASADPYGIRKAEGLNIKVVAD